MYRRASSLCDHSVINQRMILFFFKQKTAYEMRISDWSSDVCSSDLRWYDAETGGNLLSSDNSFTTAPLMTVGQITYYIAVVRNGCEDTKRIPVVVTVTASPKIGRAHV